jgi:hypothetical protein
MSRTILTRRVEEHRQAWDDIRGLEALTPSLMGRQTKSQVLSMVTWLCARGDHRSGMLRMTMATRGATVARHQTPKRIRTGQHNSLLVTE